MKMLHIVTRKTAKAIGLKRYFSGKLCAHGHVCERVAGSGLCDDCRLILGRKHDEARRSGDQRKAYMAGYLADYVKENREDVRRNARKHYALNRPLMAERGKAFRESNKDLYRGLCHERRAKVKNRIPGWCGKPELKAIRAMHKEAKRLEALTGIVFHVDHIIPIAGRLVSGLHVPENMQILTKQQNLAKLNQFDPWAFEA